MHEREMTAPGDFSSTAGGGAPRDELVLIELTLVRRIAKLHGGQVEVRSQVGRGTVVTVRLSLAPPGR